MWIRKCARAESKTDANPQLDHEWNSLHVYGASSQQSTEPRKCVRALGVEAVGHHLTRIFESSNLAGVKRALVW